MTTQHDPRGITNTLSYHYDDLDRLTAQSATNLGTIGAQYDALGRRTSLTDGTGTTQFGYDALGRMRSVQAPVTGQVGYDYDARGARTKLIYPRQHGDPVRLLAGRAAASCHRHDHAGKLQL